MRHDIFEHDDGVVDDEADRGGEAAECHEVKALTGGAENDERDQKRYGNDEPSDKRGAPVTKEKNENHRRE